MSTIRAEYPRPQFVRADWLCLNGPWQFEIDQGDSGIERGLVTSDLAGQITVPFCPESPLSGIGNTDFLQAVWYRRTVTIPAAWAGRRALLHFGAVDYDATVWANGVEVARHRGGFTPFSADLSIVAQPGDAVTIVVRARDPHRRPMPLGKQSPEYANAGCLYTRTTGIWQTVWMEPVPDCHLQRPRITPDVANDRFMLVQPIFGARASKRVRASLIVGGRTVATVTRRTDTGIATMLDLPVPQADRRLWSIEDPFLYDIKLELLDGDGAVLDAADSYCGLRSIAIDGMAIRINGKSVFQRLVLDQGYYPDGILTAPTDDDLKRDIEISMAAGFNGARLHQKVFEERFLYHADRAGYLVWGEFGDWGCNVGGPDTDNQQTTATYVTQWLEALERDYSHPCIIGWCPLNETHQRLHDRITVLDDVTRAMFLATKAFDPIRPVLDTSGYAHRVPESDVYDVHDYAQDPAILAANHVGLADGQPMINGGKPGQTPMSIAYRGQPFFVSEFGGIRWNPDAKPGDDSWGYGPGPQTLDEFHARFEGQCQVLLGNERMFGYCYTQLTDVYQEQNGIYRFDRRPKFNVDRIRSAQNKPAAIERLG
ncbi:MAG TPA: glycoside hydrolase family 2 TIM barrel-domain containing protein [Tepidisphaeraceae bacterium]|jgi:beta-galactosidase/beta-glucuronidase|nr:glycoside hydrolase family 2 TIM barrel-domain containing protein [Tepidisphaeraceae bacterium]